MLQSGDIRFRISMLGDPRTLPLRISGTLFRIGQEALANSVRHASPSQIAISVSYEENSVQMLVADDGIGFDESEDQKGFGLRGMRRRAAVISAEIEINSSPGAGTRVLVTAPLPTRLTINSLPGLVWKRISALQSHEQI
jgi:signal transduction histidine kinase